VRTVLVLALVLFVLLAGGTIFALAWRHYERRQAREIIERRTSSSGDPRDAVRELEIAMELDPGCEAAARARIASIRFAAHDPRGALTAASRALELDPSLVDTWVLRGQVRALLGDTAGAGDDFAHALALDYKHGLALLNLGHVMSARGDTKAAIDLYTRAIGRLPADPTPWRRRGRERIKLGDLTGAEADIKRSKDLGPYDPGVWVDLARLAGAKKNLREEIRCIETALAFDQESGEAEAYRKELRARLAADRK